MKEREHWELADTFSEMMYALFEANYREGRLDLDSGMRRLKDLSAYSLTHAEIMVQREGGELLALAKFFGQNQREPPPPKPGAARSFV